MWYAQIVDDLQKLPQFIRHYEREHEAARAEIATKGNLEKHIKELPSISERRFAQLQEIEAVLEFMNIQMRKLRKEKYVKYETYQKALSQRETDKYVDGDDDVVDYSVLINEVALLRNKFLGIMKGLDSKNFMVGHLARLRTAGMEDIEV